MKKNTLSRDKRDFLNKYFLYNSKPSVDEKHNISLQLEVPYKTIQIWFQNARAHMKKYEKEKELMMYMSANGYFKNDYYSDCNALCIMPDKNAVKRYFITKDKHLAEEAWLLYIPKIVAKYNEDTGYYSLSYW